MERADLLHLYRHMLWIRRFEETSAEMYALKPLDIDTIVASITKTGRLVIVGDGWRFCGLDAQTANGVAPVGGSGYSGYRADHRGAERMVGGAATQKGVV